LPKIRSGLGRTRCSTLLFSTYLGGDGDDLFQSISLNPSNGDVYLSFFTDSSNFPPGGSSVAAQAGGGAARKGTAKLVARLDENNLLRFELLRRFTIAIFSPSPDSKIRQELIKKHLEFTKGWVSDIDQNPNPSSQSGDASAHAGHPQAGGGHDVRLTVFDQDLNVTNTVYFGGRNEELLTAMTIDAQGAVYITGATRSRNDFPTVNPIQANPPRSDLSSFLAVLHPQTFQPVFSTYLGGTDALQELESITVDRQGNIYIVGTTQSQQFPAPTPTAIQNQLRGITDAFLIKISPVEITTTVETQPDAGVVTDFVLEQNYPNPFNPQTTIRFTVARPGRVRLQIYDVRGRLVETLVDRVLSQGPYTTTWQPPAAASGVYFYRIQAGNFVEVKKMILIR
jgi:hypothetical protein